MDSDGLSGRTNPQCRASYHLGDARLRIDEVEQLVVFGHARGGLFGKGDFVSAVKWQEAALGEPNVDAEGRTEE